jgi:hypothetical protein
MSRAARQACVDLINEILKDPRSAQEGLHPAEDLWFRCEFRRRVAKAPWFNEFGEAMQRHN